MKSILCWLSAGLVVITLVGCNSKGNAPNSSKREVDSGGPTESAHLDQPQTDTSVEPSRDHGLVPIIIREGHAADFPNGCKPDQVLNIINGFIRSFNAGENEKAMGFFGLGFIGYSAPGIRDGKPTVITNNLQELPAYFADRQRFGERLELAKLEIVSKTWHGGIDVVFNIYRKADDLQLSLSSSGRLVGGKGAINCKNQTIIVWGIGDAPPL
jgi:hypothetical protein